MLRTVLAIVGGVVVAFLLVMATDLVVRALSAGVTMPTTRDPAAFRAYMDALPTAALLAFVVGCGVAAFAGSAVAARFSRHGARAGWVVAGVLLLATAANFFMIPHPLWVVIAGVAAVIVGGWLGARLFAPRPRV